MQNKAFLIVIVVLILIVGGYYFFTMQNRADTTENLETSRVSQIVEDSDEPDNTMIKDETTEPADSMVKTTPTEADEAMDDTNVKVFEVNGGNFYFTPETFTVNEGDTVKVLLTNDGGTHDWVIEEFDARTEISQTGETVEVTFVADKAGEYEFYCSVGQHRANGMVGTLIVQ
jgi:plastocyanin